MLTVQLDSSVPLGEQIVQGLRHLIAIGKLQPGDELPPVRQLAADLGINLNTAARAYRELEANGLVSTARGRGTRVTASQGAGRTSQEAANSCSEGLRRALADAKLAGLAQATVESLFWSALAEFWPESAAAARPARAASISKSHSKEPTR